MYHGAIKMKFKTIIYLGLLLTGLASAAAFAAQPRFVVSEPAASEPVVTDVATKRMWQQSSTLEARVTWANALEHCETMTYGGHDDWRLPSIDELLSIVDEKKVDAPAVNTNFFTGFSAFSGLWTSTTHRKQPTAAYVVYFNEQNTTVGRGGVGGLSKSFNAQALCIRTSM
jgi:hypothetical protein